MSSARTPRTRDATEAAFEALLERPGDVVLVVDDRLRILRASARAEALAERPSGALAGMSIIAAFGSAELDAIARDAVATGSPSTGEANLGHLGVRTFRVDALPTGAGGLVLGLRDVTQIRRMERVRRDFIANISHELRTPLASVKLLAETLSSGVADTESGRELAMQIEREVDHLAQLVDELLELSRIESGTTKLSLAPVDPAELLLEVADRMRALAERRDVKLQMTASPKSAVRALADRSRLGQALVNLTHNAIKFSHTGGDVRISWTDESGHVRFTVSDDGVGIPAIHRNRIFERFYKVDRSRTRDDLDEDGGSAGLGLAIVRHIAEAHGGSVGVESQEGSGSTFWIEVPAAEPAP